MIIYSYIDINMYGEPMRKRAFKLTVAAVAVAVVAFAAAGVHGRLSDLSPALERPDMLAALGIGLLVWLVGGVAGDARLASARQTETE